MGSKKHNVTVCEAEMLSPRLRRIRFTGKRLREMGWSPGDKVKLRVHGKSRTYTPSALNVDIGWMDIVFFLHGNGPASRWAAEAKVGDRVVLGKPEKSIKHSKKAPDWAMFLGDETTVGLAVALLSSLPSSTKIVGAIELEPTDAGALNKLGLSLSSVIRGDHYGDALIDWLEGSHVPEGRGAIWIAGESVTVRTLKRMLNAQDLSKTTVKTKGYWKSKHRRVRSHSDDMRVAAK